MRLFTKYPQPKMLKWRLFFKTTHLTFSVLWSLLLHQQHHIVDDDDSVKSLGCVPTQCCCHWMLLVDNLMGLILLVLFSSFTVTVCTVRDYHRVEFQAMTITYYLQICLPLVANFLALCVQELFRMTKFLCTISWDLCF
jgi:hypothetical protein